MKKRRWTAAAVAVMLLFTGCSFGTLKEQKTGEIEYEIVKKEEIPEKLKEEIAEAEKSEMWISYADTGNEGRYLYIVKGYGRQETTGYSIEVNECYEQPGARGVSSSQVRNIIVMGTQKLPGIEYPNTQWGYGTMNLYRSLDILRQL